MDGRHLGHAGEGEFATMQQLTQLRNSADNVRYAIARVPLAPQASIEEMNARLGSVAAELEVLRASVVEPLRYQVPVPIAVPPVPNHIPMFLSVKKQTELEAADAKAEVAELRADGTHDSHLYNVSVKNILRRYTQDAHALMATVMAAPGALSSSAGAPPA